MIILDIPFVYARHENIRIIRPAHKIRELRVGVTPGDQSSSQRPDEKNANELGD
jgi:hypothetical protein